MVSTCPPTPNSRLPKISGLAIPERKRKVAIKCLELEEMLERQGHSQSEIESKVASFRALLLRQITSNQSVNNNSKSSPGRPEPDSTNPVQETTIKPKERSLSRHRDERDEEKRQHKKRKRKKEESKPRKKKKKEKRKVHYCSSPSYSDFEPEDPILRRRLRAKKDQKRIVAENVGQDKAWSSSKKEKKKKKRRRRSRSESKKSSSRSRSRSKLRKSRSIERQPKGKRRKGRSCSRLNEKVDPKICQNEEESDPQKPKEDHSKLATSYVRQNGSDSRIGNESAGKEAKEVLDEEKNGNAEEESRRKKDESGGIIVTKIDDIPTKPEWFERQTLTSRAFREVKLVEPKKVDHNSSKLKFEFNFPAKRLALKANPAAPTFAELSNKLGPTQSLSGRRLPALSQASTKAAPEPAKPTISQQKVMAKNAAEPEEQDVSENLPDIVHIKDVNGNKSKGRENSRSRSRRWSGSEGGRGGGRSRSESRSYTYSRSRSRSRSRSESRSYTYSYSYSSYYSRSRSRSQSFYSRSRSRSYYSSYSSRSRSRTRVKRLRSGTASR